MVPVNCLSVPFEPMMIIRCMEARAKEPKLMGSFQMCVFNDMMTSRGSEDGVV